MAMVLVTLVYSLGPEIIRGQNSDCVSPHYRCDPTTACQNQAGGRIKHRMPSVVPHGTDTTIQEMIGWPVPNNVDDPDVRSSNRLIDPRERRTFTIEGDLWRAKFEENDCDIHMEITTAGNRFRSKRIIAEIPADEYFDDIRAVIRNKIRQMKRAGLVKSNGDPKRAVRVRITGLAFYDGAHWIHADAVKGHGHGTAFVKTLWELHPVLALEIE
jgi:hypothetical protein